MKKFFTSTLKMLGIALVVFQLSSCEKEATASAAASTNLQGLWIGTYLVDGRTDLGQQYYSFIFKPDGTMINDSKGSGVQNLSVGTYTTKADSVFCTFRNIYGQSNNVGIVQTAKMKFDNVQGSLVGRWENVQPAPVSSGMFIMSKVE